MVDRTGADVQTNHEYVQGPTARRAAQAEPAIWPQLVTSIIKQSINLRINQAPRKKIQESKTTTTTTHQTTAPLHPSVSTQFLPYIPTFLQLPLVSVTRLHYQKVPTSAIWIPTPPVFASLSASIARNLRLLPVLLQLLVLCRP